MEQLKFDFEDNLESRTKAEFSQIMGVWEAMDYAKKHDPMPGIKYFGHYYVPSTVREMKSLLTGMYPFSKTLIRKMSAKQTRMVYHRILKFRSQ